MATYVAIATARWWGPVILYLILGKRVIALMEHAQSEVVRRQPLVSVYALLVLASLLHRRGRRAPHLADRAPFGASTLGLDSDPTGALVRESCARRRRYSIRQISRRGILPSSLGRPTRADEPFGGAALTKELGLLQDPAGASVVRRRAAPGLRASCHGGGVWPARSARHCAYVRERVFTGES